MDDLPYYAFSRHLFEKYGCRVYKAPVNVPCGCPNRDGTAGYGGCIFCGEESAGFETLDPDIPVADQLRSNMEYIGGKYNAEKFIAYFQNYTNTYMGFDRFKSYTYEACIENIVAIYISTRPDCIGEHHCEHLSRLACDKNVDIVVEMGLQSANDKTLEFLNRGHTVRQFTESAGLLKSYGIGVCAHMITDIPVEGDEDVAAGATLLSDAGVDQVKCHSLYVLKGTKLGEMYLNGDVKMLSCGDFIRRTILFLRKLDDGIVVQRLMGRAPRERTLFCNFGRSWRAVVDEIVETMEKNGFRQGDMRQG